jgi:hypothetical protein
MRMKIIKNIMVLRTRMRTGRMKRILMMIMIMMMNIFD